MQDLNNENTIPTQPNSGMEETIPLFVSQDPIDPADPMDPGSIDLTQPVPPSPVDPSPTKKAPRPRRWPWILLGIFMILLFGGGGTWIGYQSAIQLRKDKMSEQKINIATEHFMLGLTAQENKQYQIAQQQFEYVIRLDSSFPGAQDKLREVMIAMAIVSTPTPVPTVATPTMTPTRDTRPLDDIFNQAKQQIANKEWNEVFATIDSLRKADPKFRAVEVDGMLYTALRFRGVDKILHTANLEGGLYDLALAERFGPLDVDALGYRNWARMYLNGSSYWEIDWLKVMNYFEQIYPYFPNMRELVWFDGRGAVPDCCAGVWQPAGGQRR